MRVVAVASAVALIWRHPLADIAAQAAAPLGAGFTLLCLVTGSLWGEPMWGTWWVWDARLTSVLVLFFLYLGYIALINAFDDPARGARAGAILALVGVVNLPIIKFSVDWWNTLHQPASVFRLGGPTIAAVDAVAAARSWRWASRCSSSRCCWCACAAALIAAKIARAAAGGAERARRAAWRGIEHFPRDGRLCASSSGRPMASPLVVLGGMLMQSVARAIAAAQRELGAARARAARR